MKKGMIILIIAGILIFFLCVKPDDNSRAVSEMENNAVGTGAVSHRQDEGAQEKKAEPKTTEEAQSEQAQEERVKRAVPEHIYFEEPVVKWNGKTGELRYDWNYKCVQADGDTLLVVSECSFSEEQLQHKIFYLAKAPDFILREVFRKEYTINDDPKSLEARMRRPCSVDAGFVYEMEGVLYFLDEDFQEASPICDLHQLMGDLYSFSPGILYRTCDITADASRMLACTDEGLYEYHLKSGEKTLLEPAFFEHHEIVLEEGDCACGARDFRFLGPVKVKYGPDGKSYAFLTGSEEADWGDIRGVVLRTGDGETLYQKESDNMYDFKWVETQDAVYFAAFYIDDDGKEIMDRENLNTGEVMTFEAPDAIYSGGYPCCVVAFLDEDSLLYVNYHKEEGKNRNVFEIYHPSSGERQELEVEGETDWGLSVFDIDGYMAWPVRYPKWEN